jgi:hypothetical protein
MEEKQAGTDPHQGCFFCNVVGPQVESILNHLWPEETQEHFRKSRIEALKGIRSMLDAKIERLSQHGQRGSKIVVE